MDSGIELEGMNEILEAVQSMGERAGIAIKKAVESTGDLYRADVLPKIPRSLKPRKADKGVNSWRTGEHAADHIKRSKVLGKDNNYYVLIGIGKGDITKWFYLKFLEYGTSKMPAKAPFARTIIQGKSKYNDNLIRVLKEELDL